MRAPSLELFFALAIVRDRALAQEFEYGDEETGLESNFGQSPKALRGAFDDKRPARPDSMGYFSFDGGNDNIARDESRNSKVGKHKHSHGKETDKAHGHHGKSPRAFDDKRPARPDSMGYFSFDGGNDNIARDESRNSKVGKHKHSHGKETDKAHGHHDKRPARPDTMGYFSFDGGNDNIARDESRNSKVGKHKHSHGKETDKAHGHHGKSPRAFDDKRPRHPDSMGYFSFDGVNDNIARDESRNSKVGKHKHSHGKETDKAHGHHGKSPLV